MYYAMTLKMPFTGRSYMDLENEIRYSSYIPIPTDIGYGLDLIEIVNRMLLVVCCCYDVFIYLFIFFFFCKDPSERISLVEIMSSPPMKQYVRKVIHSSILNSLKHKGVGIEALLGMIFVLIVLYILII
jgi:hypothetical protein